MGKIIGFAGLGIVILFGAVIFIKRAIIDYYRAVIN